ncbi:MAG TPA: hypothetical protein P5511_07180, partial [Candidatus Goldiibacteriota bacterium]|nr:hypothetical protein [Candidatus Goldiibacteriota bacterium]
MKANLKSGTLAGLAVLFFFSFPLFVFSGDPRVISVTMNPPAPTFGDRITVDMVFCGSPYQRVQAGLAVSTKSTPQDARVSGLGQVFIMSHAGYNVHTPLPASAPGGEIGYTLITPTGSVYNCSTCGQTSPDGLLITMRFGDINPLTIPDKEYFASCDPTNLYLHLVMKNNNMADGDYNRPELCPQSLTWSIPLLPPDITIQKRVEGTMQATGDLVLFSIDYNYANGNPVITDAIPAPPAGSTWTLVSAGPSSFYSGPAAGAVTAGQMMTWTLPARAGLKGEATGTVWFLLRINGAPTPGSQVVNTANASMGGITRSSTARLVAGQAAINIRKYQSINTGVPGDRVTYTLEYSINGDQLVVYQPFDELVPGTSFGSTSSTSGGTPPAGWSFQPNKSAGMWYVEDLCGTGDVTIRGDTTQADDYPGLLYTAYPMTNTAQCLGTIITEV